MYDLGVQFHFNMDMAKASSNAILMGKKYRITILTERLVRIEYSPSGVFVDNPTALVLCRNFTVPKFEVNQDSRYLEVETSYFKLAYTKETPITASSLRISLKGTEAMWYYGYPEVKTYDGTFMGFDEGKERYNKGLYSIEGFCSIDNSNDFIIDEHGTLTGKKNPSTDIYAFLYKDDFNLALKDYFQLTGKPQLLPRYAFGNCWSKNYAYNEDTLNRLFNRFEKEEIPISSLILDKDWHITNNKFITGYTFNKELFKNPVNFINTMHQKGIRVGLHINPKEGIYPHEAMYQKVCEYIKVPSNSVISFAPFNIQFLDIYFKILLHPLESQGVDYFWLDYSNKSRLEQQLLNHYMYLDSGRLENKRNMLISRNPSVSAHRYGIIYTGRSKVGFNNLKKLPYILNNAANIGVSYISSDIGGFTGGIEDGELYIRYIEYACFSPIFRIYVDRGRYYKREPWRWDINTSQIVKNYMQLRHRLVPYIYSEAYKYHINGIPLVYPLYFNQKELYYDAFYRAEYMFGSQLLVSPITNPKDRLMNRVVHKIYLPSGVWYDFKTGKKFPGGRSYVSFYKDEDYPVYAKSGAIIPMSTKIDNSLSLPQELEIHIFPGLNNSYEFMEDDGVSNLYKDGYFLKTLIDYNYQANNYTLIIRSIEGKSNIVPITRDYKIRFRNTKKTDEVVANFNGVNLETNCYEDENDFIVEIKNVKTIGQLSINCKGKAIENDSIRLINEDIDSIISDLEVETKLKDKIASILFSNLTIKKKRIQIKKLRRDKLDSKFIKMFLRLLEYVEQI